MIQIAPPTTDDFAFHVEHWDANDMKIEEIMAVAHHIRLARAAYDQAISLYPDRLIKLRHGARLIIGSR